MAWNCGYCAHLVDADLSSCPQCGTARGTPAGAAADGASRAATARPAAQRFADPAAGAASGGPERRDLKMEGHLSAIALWYRIGGILGLLVTGLFLLLTPFAIEGLRKFDDQGILGGQSGDVITFLAIVVLGLMLLFSIGSLFLGRYLHRYSNGARIAAGVLGAVGLAFNVLSTFGTVLQAANGDAPVAQALIASFNLAMGSLWSGANLWALFNQRAAAICTPAYRAFAARQPLQRSAMYSSPFFWIPFVWIGLAFLGGLVAGAVVASIALMSS